MPITAFNTTTSVAILFAKTTLRMSAPKTIAVGVLTQFTAIFSAMMTPLVQAKLGISAKSLLVASVLGVAGMCVWGLTALNGESEMYCAAVWFGLVSRLQATDDEHGLRILIQTAYIRCSDHSTRYPVRYSRNSYLP